MEELAKGKHVVEAALQWSAVLLNRTKAKIKPLFELNRTAASVASSNNGMPTFSTPSTHTKKNSCRMLEGEKNNTQAHTRRKKIHCESRC